MTTPMDTPVGVAGAGRPRTYGELAPWDRVRFDTQLAAWKAAVVLVAQVSADLETGRKGGLSAPHQQPETAGVKQWARARNDWHAARTHAAHRNSFQGAA